MARTCSTSRCALAEAIAGELAEGALGRALAGPDLALDHHLGVRGHEHVGGLALDELERLAEEAAHDRPLVLVDGADGERAERDGGMHAEGEGHGQGLAARLGDLVELPEVLAEGQVDRRGVAPLDHEAVVGAVPRLARGVLGEGDGRGEVRPRVALVVDDLRQVVQVHAVAGQDHVLHGARGHHAGRDRLVHRAQVGAEHLLRRRAHRHGQPRAARVQVGDDGEAAAAHALEDDDGAPAALALELHDERGDLVGGVHLLRDDDELVGLVALDAVEIAPEVLPHVSLRAVPPPLMATASCRSR